MTSYLGILVAIAGLLVMAFALKDIYTSPMSTLHKILWAVIVIVFSFLGCAAYYLFYKIDGNNNYNMAAKVLDKMKNNISPKFSENLLFIFIFPPLQQHFIIFYW